MKGKKILLIISLFAIFTFAFVFIYDITNVPQGPILNQPQNNNQNQSGLPPNQQLLPPRPESPALMVPLSGVLLIVAIVAIAFYAIYSVLEHNGEFINISLNTGILV